ncbi:MAG TPA: HYR domain-containing protein, partial [Saprospiraceae bacterium]|nr:HYR domain-containing protein [Saprospiraceae bacterium]
MCKQNLLVSLSPSGDAPITWQMVAPTAGAQCPGPLELTLFNEQGVKLPDDTLRCAHIGQDMVAEVKHLPSGNRCTGTVQVRDALSPQLMCPEKMIFCLEDSSPAGLGTPDMTDNCTPSASLTVSHVDVWLDYPCGTAHNGQPVTGRLDRTWQARDQSNNSATCVERIWIRQATIADVVFPPNRDGFSSPTLPCGQDPEDLSLTGQPSINGLPLADAPSCEVGATYTDQSINYCPPAGYTVIRTWLLIDFCSNQTAQRIQIIKVEDKKPPVLSTPPPLTVSTLPFQCVATVTLPQASASDSCSAVSVSVSWDYGNGYGPYPDIPVGEHTVTYVATDACGNSATRTLRLTVADQVPPQAVCKGALQLSLGVDGSAQLPASLLDNGSTDNCGSLLRSVSRDGADFFPALTFGCADRDSTYTLTLRVQDENGLEND